MIRPSDASIARAFWEYRDDNAYDDSPEAIIERARELDAATPADGGGVVACQCGTCRPCNPADPTTVRMILCAICGNKRCPHANDHRNACTGSNEPGQPGSSWEHVKPTLHPPERQEGGELAELARFFEGLRVFVTSREKIKHPEGTNLFDEYCAKLRRLAGSAK